MLCYTDSILNGLSHQDTYNEDKSLENHSNIKGKKMWGNTEKNAMTQKRKPSSGEGWKMLAQSEIYGAIQHNESSMVGFVRLISDFDAHKRLGRFPCNCY